MYDVYVEVNENLSTSILNSVNFKMAYVNSKYTDMQITVRIIFIMFSTTVCIAYLLKVCKLPQHV